MQFSILLGSTLRDLAEKTRTTTRNITKQNILIIADVVGLK